MLLSILGLMRSYRVCIFSLVRITKLPEISLTDPGCESLEHYQTQCPLTAARDISVQRHVVCHRVLHRYPERLPPYNAAPLRVALWQQFFYQKRRDCL